MTATVTHDSYPETTGRWHFGWVFPTLFQPRQTFARIVTANQGIWQTPLFLLFLTTLGRTLVTGSLRQAAAASGQITLPPGYEFYTPEQQAQFQQALSATSGPVFTYVLPTLAAVLGLFATWLIVGWILHLVLTLLGGRAPATQTLNVVAWASLPFAVRDVVRILAMLNTNQLISYPGLSGFVTPDGSTTALYLAALLALVDLYLIAYIFLIGIGVRAGDGLRPAKAWAAVLLTVISLLLLRTLPALLSAQFNDLNIIRPFF